MERGGVTVPYRSLEGLRYDPDYLRLGQTLTHSSCEVKRLLFPRQPEYSNCSHLKEHIDSVHIYLALLISDSASYLPDDLLNPKAVCFPEQRPTTIGFSQGAETQLFIFFGDFTAKIIQKDQNQNSSDHRAVAYLRSKTTHKRDDHR